MKTAYPVRSPLLFYIAFLLISLFHLATADLNFGSAIPLTLPNDPLSFKPGPGSAIASSYCGVCHSAEYIYMQPPHSKETWTKIVHKMKSVFGCSIPDDQIFQLVKYLVSQNDIEATSLIEEARAPIPLSLAGKGNVAKGKTVYDKNCMACHGSEGKGDGLLGQRLVPPPGDLTATEAKSDQDLLQTIQNGRAGTAMPSWKGSLSPEEIQNVLAYIRSLSH
jgi:mono/diheme cytochrome c family protein